MGSHDILNGRRRFGRRGFLRGTAATAFAGLATPALIGRARADGVVLNFATYGGVLNDYMTRLFAVPFEKQTGIRVNLGGNASLALAKLQTTSGAAAQWDLINLTGAEYLAAIEENIVVPYDYSIVDASNIAPEFGARTASSSRFICSAWVMTSASCRRTRRRRTGWSFGIRSASLASARSIPTHPTAASSRSPCSRMACPSTNSTRSMSSEH